MFITFPFSKKCHQFSSRHFIGAFGHVHKWIEIQCKNKVDLNILLRKLRIFIVNTFMNITVVVGVCNYLVEMYDFDTREIN